MPGQKRMSGEAALASATGVTKIGRYRIAFELASGGMATMYLARAEGPGGFEKLAALKRIHPHLAKDQQFVEMFFDEARIASRIAHPNVCSVFDFGQADGAYYIAMDYIHGETLGRVLKRLASKPELLRAPEWPYLAARILAEAAEGLHAAHELRDDKGALMGVVHRDVSPQNLFVAYDGTVRVVDFGVAQAEGRLHQTQAGTVKGKLAYLAPEQARAKPIDRRVDVWALGVVLWETLVAKRLFQRATDAETIMSSAMDDIPAPSSVRPWLPKELDVIVLKALTRERDGRQATARELARDLHRFLARAPEPVTSHDVAEWMAQEFAPEKAERERWIDESRTANFASPPRVTPTVLSGPDVAGFNPEVDLVGVGASDIVPVGELDHTKRTPAPPAAALVDGTHDAPTVALRSAVPTETAIAVKTAPPPVAGAAIESSPALEAPQEASFPSVPSHAVEHAPAAAPGQRGSARLLAGLLLVAALAASVGVAWKLTRAPEPMRAVRVAPLSAPPPMAETAPPAIPGPTPPAVPVATPVVAPPANALSGRNAPTVIPPSAELDHRVAAPVRAPRVTAARTERAPGGTGTVAIATPGGWADVYLGNRQVGRAPGQVVVPAGRSALRVLPFGREPARRVNVDVAAGGTSRVVVPLTP